tara:strand:+ start:2559 stop:2948 length:390 start_codon:yes stop_codon:yes gene_type:complete
MSTESPTHVSARSAEEELQHLLAGIQSHLSEKDRAKLAKELVRKMTSMIDARSSLSASELAHQKRWFTLRLLMGYVAVGLLIAVMILASWIILHEDAYSETVVTGAIAALFADILGVLGAIWKLVITSD